MKKATSETAKIAVKDKWIAEAKTAKIAMKDKWIAEAKTDDQIVAELLIQMKHNDTVVSDNQSKNLSTFQWGIRQPRFRSSRFVCIGGGVHVSSKKEVDSVKASPKTPLTWNDGSGSNGDSASHSAVTPGDGFDDTSRQSYCSTSTGFGSKNFWVDIKGSQLGFLPVLAFEGGTRRNIPKFEVGTLLYVRIVKTKPGMNPELSCTNANGKASEFGPLKDGFMFETSTGLSKMLLSTPTCPVLEALGKKLSFEMAVGLNGRVWVKAAVPRTVIIAANAIMNSEFLSRTQQILMVENLLAKISD